MSLQTPIVTITPIQHYRFTCPKCENHKIWGRGKEAMCSNCFLPFSRWEEYNWPFPTKGRYSRARMLADLEGIELLSQELSALVRLKVLNPFDVPKVEARLEKMRKKCRFKLRMLAERIQEQVAEKANGTANASFGAPVDSYGRRLSSVEVQNQQKGV